MEEKYFIIDVKNRECGPFTEDELNDIGLYQDSLIFCADWSERKPLNQIPELANINRRPESIKLHNPDYGKENSNLTMTHWVINPFTFRRKKSKMIFATWIFIHCTAFLFSSIGIQNNEGEYSSYSSFSQYEVFWPFVSFVEKIDKIDYGEWHPYYNQPNERFLTVFHGIFYKYDISEFLFYNFLFVFIWFILYTKNQKS